MGRILVIVACNFAYWQYDDGSTSRLAGWDYCERPPVHLRAPSVIEAVVARRRRRPVRWDLPTPAEALHRRGGVK
jgi:hypothetical protein